MADSDETPADRMFRRWAEDGPLGGHVTKDPPVGWKDIVEDILGGVATLMLWGLMLAGVYWIWNGGSW